MTDKQTIRCARTALDGLGASIETEYARCAILTEADVQAIVVDHLKKELRDRAKGWIIGANHLLGVSRPDVLCYSAPLTYDEFVSDYLDGYRALVAIIEIKWACPLEDDLAKLSRLQREHGSDILAWMVYGGHFDPSIHSANAAEDERRKDEIQSWAKKDKEWTTLRGHTIVQCGNIAGHGVNKEWIRAMKERWWINDRAAKAGQVPRCQGS